MLAKLKARIVEKSLVKKDPEELAAIAVTSLSIGGLAHVGSVSLDTAISSAGIVHEAEKYAESILSKTTTGIGSGKGIGIGRENELIQVYA